MTVAVASIMSNESTQHERHAPNRVLVTFGSKRTGTEGIATKIAETLRELGHAVDCVRANEVRDLGRYAAVIVGGALYAHRWVREASRFVRRNVDELRRVPVWMFSSGPLDNSATERDIEPVPQVRSLMARVGARAHATFGGSLATDAKGFIAAAMAKKVAGDWRDWEQVQNWAFEVSMSLERDPHVAAPPPVPRRWLLAALCLFVGLTAIGGGIALVASPSGSYVKLPLAILAHSPFTSFLIPGLLLLCIVGVGNLIAGVLVACRARSGDGVAAAAGVALFVWIVTEMVMLRTVEPFQVAYLAIALAIMVESVRRWSRARIAYPLRPIAV